MKKLIIILIILMLAGITCFAFSYFSIGFTGTTVTAYTVVDSLVVTDIGDVSVCIANADTANALSYKLYYYFGSWDGLSYEAKTDSIAGGESVYYASDDPMYGIKVSIKSTVADSTTTYNGRFDFQK